MSLSFVVNILKIAWDEIRSTNFACLLELPLRKLHEFLTTDPFPERKQNDSYEIYSLEPIRDFNIRVITWNIFSQSPPEVHRILNLMNMMDDLPCERADFYAIGLQEHANLLKMCSTGMVDPWICLFKEALSGREYILLASKKINGIMLMCFAKRKHILRVRHIECQETGSGRLCMKKGAVSVRMSISGCEVCLINCHLPAHDSGTEQRLEDYRKILDNHKFKLETRPDILSHDIIFWFGDLNFRLNCHNSCDAHEILSLIQANARDKLLQMDELRQLMEERKIFQGFTEQIPNFPPTYKFETDSHYYDLNRKPAWCDRILYRVKSNPYANVEFSIDQQFYTSYEQCKVSDHRPVASEFNIKFAAMSTQPSTFDMQAASSARKFEDLTQHIVEFSHIPYWIIDGENTVEYYLPYGFTELPGCDWIGLYCSDFDDLSSYILRKEVVAHPHSPEFSSPIPALQGLEFLNRGPWRRRKLTINGTENDSISTDGRYVLLYFEEDKTGAYGVAGISNSFKAAYSAQIGCVDLENRNLKSI